MNYTFIIPKYWEHCFFFSFSNWPCLVPGRTGWLWYNQCFWVLWFLQYINFSSLVTIVLMNRWSFGFFKGCIQIPTRPSACSGVDSCGTTLNERLTFPNLCSPRLMVDWETPSSLANARVLCFGSASTESRRAASSNNNFRPKTRFPFEAQVTFFKQRKHLQTVRSERV